MLSVFQVGSGCVWLFLVGVNCLNLMDSVLNVFLFGLRCFGSFFDIFEIFLDPSRLCESAPVAFCCECCFLLF